MDELKKAFIILAPYVGILGVLLTGVSFLIRQWISGQEKVKALETMAVLTSVSSLDKELKETRESLKTVTGALYASREELVRIQVKMDGNAKSATELIKHIAIMKKDVDHRIKDLEVILSDAEMVKVGQGFMIRSRTKKE
jgi:hypothetical protein